jgi:hypothetical protein
MDGDVSDSDQARLRLLECWLPLAQQLNQDGGWGYDPPALEALILAAAPALAESDGATIARAVLWWQHLLQGRSRP